MSKISHSLLQPYKDAAVRPGLAADSWGRLNPPQSLGKATDALGHGRGWNPSERPWLIVTHPTPLPGRGMTLPGHPDLSVPFPAAWGDLEPLPVSSPLPSPHPNHLLVPPPMGRRLCQTRNPLQHQAGWGGTLGTVPRRWLVTPPHLLGCQGSCQALPCPPPLFCIKKPRTD